MLKMLLHLKQVDIWTPLHYGSRFRVLDFALMVKASLKTSIKRRSQNLSHRGDPPWYKCHTFSQLDQGNVIGSNQDPLRVHLDPFSRHPHLDSQKIDQRLALDVIFKYVVGGSIRKKYIITTRICLVILTDPISTTVAFFTWSGVLPVRPRKTLLHQRSSTRADNNINNFTCCFFVVRWQGFWSRQPPWQLAGLVYVKV